MDCLYGYCLFEGAVEYYFFSDTRNRPNRQTPIDENLLVTKQREFIFPGVRKTCELYRHISPRI